MTPATAAAILSDSLATEARILAEGNERPMACARCMLTVVDRFEGLDDHTTDVLVCLKCKQSGFVTTKFANGRHASRPMKPAELAQYANYKERR